MGGPTGRRAGLTGVASGIHVIFHDYALHGRVWCPGSETKTRRAQFGDGFVSW